MPELKKFDYFFLRYAPYPTMDDYVSFGVVMLENAPGGFAGVRFMKSWRRLLCSHPDADLDYFGFLEQDIREHLASGIKRDELLARMYDCFGNAVQLSAYRECMAEDAEAAMELLAHGSIDLPAQAGKLEARGRRRILGKIQNAYQSAGIWGMVFKNVPVSEYTLSGDPLKIDISYRPNGIVKMLQAISLEVNIDGAKALAFSYPQLVAGIARKEEADTSLTAIVDDDLDRNDPEVGFALATLERSGIAVAVAAELPQIAEKARGELMA
jgi:hypothetical protein